MKRKVLVTINADDETCGKCARRTSYWCELFFSGRTQATTLKGSGMIDYIRCRACLAAERKAKGGGK